MNEPPRVHYDSLDRYGGLLEGENVLDALWRLKKTLNWTKAFFFQERKLVYSQLKEHLTNYFSNLNLEGLKFILQLFHLPLGESKTECKKIIKTKLYINLFDLADQKYDKVFKNRFALANYTRKHRRFFPKDIAKDCHWDIFLQEII